MEKIDYKAIVDKAIGKKPSLVKQPFTAKEWKDGAITNEKFFNDYPRTPDQSFEYKQQTYQEFLNDKQDTK
jgi:hypothetical protein